MKETPPYRPASGPGENSNLSDMFKQLDLLKTELDKFRPLSPEQVRNLKKVFDVDLTYHSNAIEGSSLTFAETKFILQEGITVGGKKLIEHLEVVNHKEAIDFVEDLATQKRPQEITERDLLNVHYLILKTIDTPNAGKYRNVPVFIRQSEDKTHRFCEPYLVPKKMEDFFLWLAGTGGEHPVQLAADAHYKFVSIHPFIDGNGRTARLLMNLILMQSGFPPAVITLDRRHQYLDAIAKVQGGDEESLNDFYRLVSEAVQKSLELYLVTLKDNIHYQ